MSIFKTAFEDSTKKWMGTAAAGLTGAAGLYGLMRHGKTKGLNAFQRNARKRGLLKVISKEAPKSRLGKAVDRVIHGADDVHYVPGERWGDIPKIKTDKSALLNQKFQAPKVKGKHVIGAEGNLTKREEIRAMRKMDKGVTSPAELPTARHKGKRGLAKIHKKMGDKNYFVKADYGFDSGIGGGAFPQKKDVEKYLKGTLKGKKKRILDDFSKNPKKYLVQQDMGIDKTLIGKKSKEFRIHAQGNKVIRGASSSRAGNIFGKPGETGEAERFLEKHLKKIPKKHRNKFIAADVAKTKDGKYKVVELNMGPNSSGLLLPEHIRKRHGNIAALEAVRKNMQMYKHFTGRRHVVDAAARAAAGGSALAGGAYAAQTAAANR